MKTSDIPDISQEDLVPGTILVGTCESFVVSTFPFKPNNGYSTCVFNSNTDIAVIVSVKNDNKEMETMTGYKNADMILLNIRQKTLFVCNSKSKYFATIGFR